MIRQPLARLLALTVLLTQFAVVVPAPAQVPSPHAIEIPSWFTPTFLDFREDIAEAARQGKRLMVYFGQDGCPYCKQLMVVNFAQKDIVAKTRKNFVAVDVNIWGDREVTWLDGRTFSEKAFAAFLKVQFTPTILFFDEKGQIAARLNGYYPPHRFDAALDYVAGKKESQLNFAEYMKAVTNESASPTLHDEPFFMAPPLDLTRRAGSKPLAVVFETPYCASCDEMHREGLKRPEMREQLAHFDVARVPLGSPQPLVTPGGQQAAGETWARELKVAYAPSIVFFDERGAEVFRTEAYVRPFHLIGSFEYVSTGAYRTEPLFQRFLQQKSERMREEGKTVDLWK